MKGDHAVKGERVAVLLLVLGMSALAWRNVHRPSIWFDEGWSWWVARMSIEEGLRQVARDRHPPLRPLLDHLWIRMAGETELALRWPSGAFALLTLALTWRMYRLVWRESPGGSAAAGLLLLSPLWIEQARQARMYTQAAFLALSSWWAMERWLRHPSAWRSWVLWASVSQAFLFTHYYAVFFLAIEVLILLWACERGERWRIFLAIGFWGILMGAWMAFGGVSTGLFLPQETDLAEHPLQGLQTLLQALRSLLDAYLPISSPTGAALTLALWIIGARPVGNPAAQRWAALAFGSTAIAVIAMAGIRSNLLNFAPRHVLYGLPLAAMGVGRGLQLLTKWGGARCPSWMRTAVGNGWVPVLIIFSVCWIKERDRLWSASGEGIGPEREAVRLVSAHGHREDILFTLRGHYGIRYYWTRQRPSLALVDGPQNPVLDEETVAAWLQFPDLPCEGDRNLWIIAWQEDIVDPLSLFPRWLLWNGFEEERIGLEGLRLYRYHVPCRMQPPPLPVLELSIDFAPGIRLQSVQIWPPHRPDRILRITTVWQRTAPIREPVKIFHHLYDESGRLMAQEDALLARGFYPAARWPAHVPITFFVGIPMPAGPISGLHHISIGLYNPETMVRYPLVGGADATTALGVATLDPQAVNGQWEAIPVPDGAIWRDGIALSNVWLDPGRQARRGTSLHVLTEWIRRGRHAQERAAPVVTFVHLWDAEGRLIAQDDHPLLRGRDPSSQWEPWKSVWDRFDLPIPEAVKPGRYRLVVGRYEWPSVQRIGVGGQDHLEIATVEVLP